MYKKQWLCKRGHVLGFIAGGDVPRLELLRHAIDLTAEEPAPVDVLGALTGRMPVSCDVPGCDDVRLWEVSSTAALDLVERVGAARLNELFARRRARRAGGMA